MKKLKFIFLIPLLLFTQQVFAFFVTPSVDDSIKVFPDGTVVFRWLECEESPYKLVGTWTSNGKCMVGIIYDDKNECSIESLKASTANTFPYTEKIVYGSFLENSPVENEYYTTYIYNGIPQYGNANSLNVKVLTSVKEWKDKHGRLYTFKADGTGTITVEFPDNFWRTAYRIDEHSRRGSNQYQKKMTNDYGGGTGGYDFLVIGKVVDDFKWAIRDSVLSIQQQQDWRFGSYVRTTLDDDKSAAAWLKKDLTKNHDVLRAKADRERSLFTYMYNVTPINEDWLINGAKKNWIWLNLNYMLIPSSEKNFNPKDTIPQHYIDWQEALTDAFNVYSSRRRFEQDYEKVFANVASLILSSTNGNYHKDFESNTKQWQSIFKVLNDEFEWKNISRQDILQCKNLVSLGKIENITPIEFTNAIELSKSSSTYVTKSVPQYLYYPKCICRVTVLDKNGFPKTYETDLAIDECQTLRNWVVILNKSFTYLKPIKGKYEELCELSEMIQNRQDSLAVSYANSPIFKSFNSYYGKYDKKIIKDLDDTESRLITLKKAQDNAIAAIIAYENVIASNDKILSSYAKHKQLLNAYKTYAKPLAKITWTLTTIDELIQIQNVQKEYLRFINSSSLDVVEKALKKEKDKSMDHVISLMKANQ